MYRASHALKKQHALRKQLGHVDSCKLQHVKSFFSPLEGSADSISKFQEEAFRPGTPLLITPDRETVSKWRNGDQKSLARHWSSSFLAATAWFNVHESDAQKSTTLKYFYTIRPEGDLAQQQDLVLPYELVTSDVDQEFSPDNWRLRNFREYSKEKGNDTVAATVMTTSRNSISGHVIVPPPTPLDIQENLLGAMKVLEKEEKPESPALLPTMTIDQMSGDKLVRFQQFNAPLRMLLEADKMAYERRDCESLDTITSLYIAQAQIADLPQILRNKLSPPEIVLKAGKGDIYDSNIWLGIAPTYTPLHKDPNPNYFAQIAGDKVVRLFPPDMGLSIFQKVQLQLGRHGSPAIRGDEMMQGPERQVLHDTVWYDAQKEDGYEVEVATGDALFIPQGWWHSIKSVGHGVNMSANWWFR